MVEASLGAPDDVRPWSGILTQPRRALRVAADERLWVAPLVVGVGLRLALWGLGALTGEPPERSLSGHPAGDVALLAAIVVLVVVIFPFGLGRLVGGRATLGEVAIVVLWTWLPALAVALPINAEARAMLEARWKDRGIEVNEARLRMARIPEGASLIVNNVSAAPGFRIGTAQVPINVDSFTVLGLHLIATPIFPGFVGALDAEGCATARLVLPPLPGLANQTMHFAFVQDPARWDFASNAAALRLLP